jgi:hypothetical protein
MRKLTWIRYGLASVILVGGAGGLAALGCSGDDNVGPGLDAGSDSPISPPDNFVPPVDGNVDSNPPPTDAPPAPKHAKLILVNASPDFGPARFCFATSPDGTTFTIAGVPARPDTVGVSPLGTPLPPGLYQGTGGPLPDLLDYSQIAVRAYVIHSASIATQTADAGAAEKTCDQLVGTGGSLTAGQDYFQIPGNNGSIPKGLLAHNTTWVIALTGCGPAAPNDAGDGTGIPQSTARCGADWTGATGNIDAKLFQLDTTTAAPDGGFGAQTVHAASALDGIEQALLDQATGLPLGVAQNTGFAAPGVDGGPPTPLGLIALMQTYNTVAPAAAAPNLGVVLANQASPTGSNVYSVVTVATNADAAVVDDAGQPMVVDQFGLPLGVISLLSTGVPGGPDGGYFQAGENYGFVIVGDPEAEPLFVFDDAGTPSQNPNYNGFGVHVIAFPAHLAVPTH